MKNGIKIMNLEGADVLRSNVERGCVIKEKWEAVFSNSMLSDKLSGVLTVKDFKTKDIINLKFNMPVSKIEKDTYKNYSKYIVEDKKDNKDKISAEDIRNILYKDGFTLTFRKEKTITGSSRYKTKVITDFVNNQYIKMSTDAVQENQIEENIEYYRVVEEVIDKKTNKVNKIEKYYKVLEKEAFEYEKIKYKFWFRSSSKARVGECLFLSQNLLDDIIRWQCMGIDLPEGKESMVVEMMAYMALTSSTIESYIEINPSEILVIDDLNSRHWTNCANVITDSVIDGNGKEIKQCKVVRVEDYVKNVLFDGQALIDDSMFSKVEKVIDKKNVDNYKEAGMMLLRHHFFKACAFRTNLQEFMKDKYKENYETATIKDRYGNDILVKDIKMITTENAMKWEKFFDNELSQGFERWKAAVKEDNNLFGICKVDHESKFGQKQRMSYQMTNTIPVNEEELTEIAQYSMDYINKLKNTDNVEFRKYLNENISILNPNKMMLDLLKHNERFAKTELFKKFKTETICKLKNNLRKGKLMVDADNLTVVGNPYLMLLHSVGDVEVDKKGFVITKDPTLPVSDEYISVYTERFNKYEELAAFRNPHNSPNNIALFKNFKNDLMNKYFNFSKNIIAVNLVDTELQDLANGMDADSDFMFTTNDKNIVEVVKKKVFRKFPCIVNKIPKSKKTYTNTMENKAIIDNALAKGKNDIGTSSNQAQISMSMFANSDYKEKEILDKVMILSVLAQVAIDNAKRVYEVDAEAEINRLSNYIVGYMIDFNGYRLAEVNTKKDIDEVLDCFCNMSSDEVFNEIDKVGGLKNISDNKYLELHYDLLDEYEKYGNITSFNVTEIKSNKRPLFFYYIKNTTTEYKAIDEKGKCKGIYKNKYEAKVNAGENGVVKETHKKNEKEEFDENIQCTMNVLQIVIDKNVKNASKKKGETENNKDLILTFKGKPKYKKADEIKELVEDWNNFVIKNNYEDEDDMDKKMEAKQQEEYLVENMIEEIKEKRITDKTMNYLILSALNKDSKNSNSHIRIKLLNALYQSKKRQFLNQFKGNVKTLGNLKRSTFKKATLK